MLNHPLIQDLERQILYTRREVWVNYELVLGMKVKSCINPQRWGATIDLDFPRIYVWDCNDIKGLNVTVEKYLLTVKEIINNLFQRYLIINLIYLILRRTKILSWLDKLNFFLSKFHGFCDLFSVFKDMNADEDIKKTSKKKSFFDV